MKEQIAHKNQVVVDIISIIKVFFVYIYTGFVYFYKYFERYENVRW